MDPHPKFSTEDETVTRTTSTPEATVVGTRATTPSATGDGVQAVLDDIEIGSRVGEFDLLTELGSGAFARVFLARQRSMQRMVAVKISTDRGTEPQTLAQLDHDYIVRVFDQRLLYTDIDRSGRRLRLLYMQFLPGGTLLNVLRWVRATPPEERSGQLLLDAVDTAMEEKGEIRPTDSSVRAEIARLSWPETVAWLGRRLAEALDYASAHGVLHRDVKPANVLLTSDAVPKLADFNISFSRDIEGAGPVAYFGGSLSYMSPEHLEASHPDYDRWAADLDTRADIYSLGVVLWELLTGSKPFDDTTAGKDPKDDKFVLEAMLQRRLRRIDDSALQRIPADCPATLRRVLLTCLEPDRNDRWSHGAVLAKQFELCLDRHARDLVDPAPGSWRLRLRPWPWMITVLFLAIGVPNILASLYNVHYNRQLIVDRLTPEAQETFIVVTGTVNAVAYPLAVLILFYLSRRLILVPHGLHQGKRYDAATLRRARIDSLLLGDRAVFVVSVMWIAAAIIFPTVLHLATGTLTLHTMMHLLTSIMVCGAIAVTYPFFLVVFYMMSCIYPLYLRHGEISTSDALRLRRLNRRCHWYLTLAASIPLLAVAGVTFLQPIDISAVIVAIRLLCLGGVIAFAGSYLLFRALSTDLRALERVAAPDETFQRREARLV
ncbi:serine/threonine-protein kinase [Nocardia brevicatena]|uniref:serine/threonine-protein kinase n=1 Tax=Nocardia brevicatena TaxID=37327 RepID=UPI000A00FCA6|nr:serine/threonine-protein kinase [Nocardia brevicatena]